MISNIKYLISNYYWNRLYKKKAVLEGLNKILPKSEISGSRIGIGSYIGRNCVLPQTLIGRFCSLAGNIKVIRGSHPSNTFVSTHPAFFSPLKQAGFTFSEKLLFEELVYIDQDKKYFVEIGNDVWIGEGVMLMQGIKIGDGAIIGAGAIVTKDIEPYSICVGIPAKTIKYRFPPEQIEWLLEIKWWNYPIEEIKRNSHLFNNIEEFKKH